MKTLLRNTFLYSAVLYILPKIFSGVVINGGLQTLVIGGLILAIMMFTIKPILAVISFPLNVLTLGMSSLLSNALVLYLFTIFYPNIAIRPFTFPGMTIFGFVVPNIQFNLFFAFVVTAFVLSAIISFIQWLID